VSEEDRDAEEQEEFAERRVAGELTVDAWLDTDPPSEELPPEGGPEPVATPGLWERLRRMFGAKS